MNQLNDGLQGYGSTYGLSGGVVFLVSSVLVTVPSDPWVTVFSFDLTVPSLLTLVSLVLETSRSQPTSRNDNATADDTVQITNIGFFISFFPFSLLTQLDPFPLVITPSVGCDSVQSSSAMGLALAMGEYPVPNSRVTPAARAFFHPQSAIDHFGAPVETNL